MHRKPYYNLIDADDTFYGTYNGPSLPQWVDHATAFRHVHSEATRVTQIYLRIWEDLRSLRAAYSLMTMDNREILVPIWSFAHQATYAHLYHEHTGVSSRPLQTPFDPQKGIQRVNNRNIAILRAAPEVCAAAFMLCVGRQSLQDLEKKYRVIVRLMPQYESLEECLNLALGSPNYEDDDEVLTRDPLVLIIQEVLS